VAESLLQQNWERQSNYHARRAADNVFEVHYSKESDSNCKAQVEINRDERIEVNENSDNDDDDDNENSDNEDMDALNDDDHGLPEQREIRPIICSSPVPLFRLVRMVQLHKDVSVQCSCCLFERSFRRSISLLPIASNTVNSIAVSSNHQYLASFVVLVIY
jgi:hypothetical protein